MEIRREPGRLVVRRPPDARFAWGCLGPLALAVWASAGGLAALASRGNPVILGAVALAGVALFLPVLAYARSGWRVEATPDALVFVEERLLGERRRSWPAGEVAAFGATQEADSELQSCFLILKLRNGGRERLTRGRSDELRAAVEVLTSESDWNVSA